MELEAENEYNGKPNPSNDAAWTRLFKSKSQANLNEYSTDQKLDANIRLKPHELEKTKRTSIELADGSGDFYGTLGKLISASYWWSYVLTMATSRYLPPATLCGKYCADKYHSAYFWLNSLNRSIFGSTFTQNTITSNLHQCQT